MKTNISDPKFKPFALIISLSITLAIGVVAAMSTRPEIANWYVTLKKPDFTPPNWLFPVAWTTLYILIGIAAYLVWQLRDGSRTYKTALTIYIIQLMLNFSWPIVFFGMHDILSGLVIIIALLVTIILNISWFGRFSRAAAWLLAPYLLWVGYAMLLNLSIFVINK
ncbi:tryptophan-rich sensory protein [Mucilaginibacter sp. RB4R14]|uniref:TspO/MBR family protein n=1 Tax=Mucilaginibacter aurantiaciroseus TaxID=2949308 RepID=UPI00208FFB52|nr:TspO/MBR family protein [Mucilaginibacter aurantiaciroseus]MCO5934304.1 tryptophan-rich sensory protein [Mucilaginibacter aurantiaciroseus]